MPAPSFIQEAETALNTATSPKTTASFNVLAGDVLVAFAGNGDMSFPDITISGGSLTWTLRQAVQVAEYAEVFLWTAVVDSAKSMTVTLTAEGASTAWGGNVLTFRGSDGVGASAKTNANSGTPTLNLTTTQANSAIVVCNVDWNGQPGTGRTWLTNAGALTEQTFFRDGSVYTIYGGFHADAGAVGTYAVGLSAPTGQKYSLVAVEVQGTAGGGGGFQRAWARACNQGVGFA